MVSKSADRHRKKVKPTKWGEAAAKVLKAAAARALKRGGLQATLAAELGEQKAYVNRFLTGRRKPSQDAVRRINRAIGKLTAHPDVQAHLDAEALGAELTADLDTEAFVEASLGVLERYQGLLAHDYYAQVGAFVENDIEKTTKLLVELNRALGEIIVAELAPRSEPVGFSTICDALRRCGFDPAKIVSDLGARQEAWERFEWVLRQELARANREAPASERREAERRIFEALDENFRLSYEPEPKLLNRVLRRGFITTLGRESNRKKGS